MEYKVETSLYNFPAWQGGRDTLDVIIDKCDCQEVEEFIETVFFDQDVTDEDINDFLWFERDAIAEHLGYTDWESYEDGEEASEEDGEEDEFLDMNGTPIKVGDTVAWDDEAGENEDGSMIQFKVVDEDANGYFNIAYEGEENPERWAYCGELEVLE
jgi:hypothetical protein